MGTKADLVRDLAAGTGHIGRTADDEPVFLICARDITAASTIHAWVRRATVVRANPDKIAGALRIANEVEAWQAAHPDQIKVPD